MHRDKVLISKTLNGNRRNPHKTFRIPSFNDFSLQIGKLFKTNFSEKPSATAAPLTTDSKILAELSSASKTFT